MKNHAPIRFVLLVMIIISGVWLQAGTPGEIKLLLPKNNISTVMSHPFFDWEAVEDKAVYHIEISKDKKFRKIVDSDTIARVSRYVPAVQLHPDVYFWRVRVRGDKKASEIRYQFCHSL